MFFEGKKVRLKSCLVWAVCVVIWCTSVVCVYADGIEKDISGSLVRLHVLANTNDEFDVAIKHKVRDFVLGLVRNDNTVCETGSIDVWTAAFLGSEGTEQASLNQGGLKLKDVENSVNKYLKSLGVSYKANATFCEMYFPTKVYNNLALPAGEYRAVRILLGEARGDNWWCIMYPPLCMNNAVEGSLEESSWESLNENMGQESFDVIRYGSSTDGDSLEGEYVVKFKVVEWFGEVKEGLCGLWEH